MQAFVRSLIVLFLFLGLAGCAGLDEFETPPVEEKGAPAPTAQTAPAAPAPGPEAGALADKEKSKEEKEDFLSKRQTHFAFDSSAIDEEARAIIEAHAAHLVAHPDIRASLEGHCDERGTREYNLALGERRAQAVERLMRVLGVAANRIVTVSYGEEKPLNPEHNESAWRQNRRVEIVYK
ncbi:MAG: peptidoglycan-associated lipoprotein [Candidatus Muproteobacteria bacterium RBG_16_65_34]|uniref:Peptidoglycan-associated lipoprotein n=1 Tax=Candidatus Muproteobacteria bacterium RBG_16_65_34 TaxID=1817760 RepID=A0A1F6TVC0_9PROT|nr:MAG: peptidoglycan-associated lipoprotein [Candidatus Muproteobacteria bacterium RBG_16_65_34]